MARVLVPIAPGCEELEAVTVIDAMGLSATQVVTEPVVIDGKVVTSRGPGTAMDFALSLIEVLEGRAKRDEVETQLQR